MTSEISDQVTKLRDKIIESCDAFGEESVALMQQETTELLQWIKYILESQLTGTADNLINGLLCSIREAAACAALGLVRPALFAMRSQVDLTLAWLYFKDHPVEWNSVNERGESFKLKKEILDYLTLNFPGFSARLSLLTEVKLRTTVDPYKLLSAHVHAQSELVLPKTENLADVVHEKSLSIECVGIAKETCEYISDILICFYTNNWDAIPAGITQAIEKRLDKKINHKKRFFDGA
ncbi:hypothetical protein J2W28_000237 [Variovorax boronicumulans]|uniref:hypothetical protein n=1 Tax=Variovorax boronicumulans TaxID=436515 RepID=UPI00278A6D14|nr:hypothetical protein [Variovorax boronicumulans]MDP9990380.1 hypothetical protein [Variovorax boronicumulans]MDQ0001109.1 hypothetical protein [Variovorax boronicumulans]